jgi:hypothetical protein
MEIKKLFPISNNINNNPNNIKMNIKNYVLILSLGENPHYIFSNFFYIRYFWYYLTYIKKIRLTAIIDNH